MRAGSEAEDEHAGGREQQDHRRCGKSRADPQPPARALGRKPYLLELFGRLEAGLVLGQDELAVEAEEVGVAA